MKAVDKLLNKNCQKKFICVGLDTDIEKIPSCMKSSENPIINFNKKIIESTIEDAAAYKINFAFYEKDGVDGIKSLSKTLSFIPQDILVIADAKRGDIGNTSKMYARSVFEYFNFDAVTLNPLMGKDSIEPFLEYEDKLSFILALTSNKSADDFQKLKLESGIFLYQHIIKKINEWNLHANCGVVFGATNIKELKENIKSFNSLPVLLPGVGAQGGSLEDVVSLLKEAGKKNFLINVSRGLLYKSDKEDFADIANRELQTLNKKIREILN